MEYLLGKLYKNHLKKKMKKKEEKISTDSTAQKHSFILFEIQKKNYRIVCEQKKIHKHFDFIHEKSLNEIEHF